MQVQSQPRLQNEMCLVLLRVKSQIGGQGKPKACSAFSHCWQVSVKTWVVSNAMCPGMALICPVCWDHRSEAQVFFAEVGTPPSQSGKHLYQLCHSYNPWRFFLNPQLLPLGHPRFWSPGTPSPQMGSVRLLCPELGLEWSRHQSLIVY